MDWAALSIIIYIVCLNVCLNLVKVRFKVERGNLPSTSFHEFFTQMEKTKFHHYFVYWIVELSQHTEIIVSRHFIF